jgi:hypothetical protein
MTMVGARSSAVRRLEEIGRHRRTFVRHVDELDVAVAAPQPLLIGPQALAVDVRLLLTGLDHPLARVVIIAGAEVVVAGAGLMPLGG